MKTKVASKDHCFGSAAFAGALLLFGSALVAPAQNVFVANWYSPGLVFEFTPGGTGSNFYSGGLGEPEGLAFDRAGNLFVADSLDGNVLEITLGGTLTTFASGMGDVNALAFDHAGNLFVSDYADGNIYEFSPDGSQSTFASGFSKPAGLAFDKAGNLFVSDSSGNIYECTSKGTISVFASGLVGPSGLAFNSTGDLFVTYGGTGAGDGGIMEITPGGVMSSFAAALYGPGYLAFDSDDNLFVADGSTGNVIEFSPDGKTSTTVATGLGNATGVAIQGEDLPVHGHKQIGHEK